MLSFALSMCDEKQRNKATNKTVKTYAVVVVRNSGALASETDAVCGCGLRGVTRGDVGDVVLVVVVVVVVVDAGIAGGGWRGATRGDVAVGVVVDDVRGDIGVGDEDNDDDADDDGDVDVVVVVVAADVALLLGDGNDASDGGDCVRKTPLVVDVVDAFDVSADDDVCLTSMSGFDVVRTVAPRIR
jgi:hypothetical protein